MLSLILIKLNEEKAIYEFRPNASEWHTVHALNKLEEYGRLNSFPKTETIYWY